MHEAYLLSSYFYNLLPYIDNCYIQQHLMVLILDYKGPLFLILITESSSNLIERKREPQRLKNSSNYSQNKEF